MFLSSALAVLHDMAPAIGLKIHALSAAFSLERRPQRPLECLASCHVENKHALPLAVAVVKLAAHV